MHSDNAREATEQAENSSTDHQESRIFTLLGACRSEPCQRPQIISFQSTCRNVRKLSAIADTDLPLSMILILGDTQGEASS